MGSGSSPGFRIVHQRTYPYQPPTDSKAERFNRTLADEFLYARRFRSETVSAHPSQH